MAVGEDTHTSAKPAKQQEQRGEARKKRLTDGLLLSETNAKMHTTNQQTQKFSHIYICIYLY